MRNTKSKICPICKKPYTGYPAISRTDNKTEICSQCGTDEALADFARIKKADKFQIEWDEYIEALHALTCQVDNLELYKQGIDAISLLHQLVRVIHDDLVTRKGDKEL